MADSAGVLAARSAPQTTAAPQLVVAGITKTFGGPRPAIEDVGFTVHEHEFVAVLGPSGAGKTTLFRCVTGLLAPDRGTVTIGGADLASLRGRARRRIAVVFQQFNLVSRLSALDNVLAGRLGHVSTWRVMLRRFPAADRQLALAALDRVGLLAHAEQRADSLSGGQQQRVAIARALAQRSRFLLADEPVASLDPESAKSVLAILREIARERAIAVLMSLHQVDFAMQFADRVIGLRAGRMVADCAVGQFADTDRHMIYAT